MRKRVFLRIMVFIIIWGTISAKTTFGEATQTNNINEVDQILYIKDKNPDFKLENRKPLFLIHGWSFQEKPAPPNAGYLNKLNNFILNDPVLSEKYKPYYVEYWSNYVSIPEIAEAFREQVEDMGFHEKEVIILAHSMGGLVARSYMNEQSFSQGIYKDRHCGKHVNLLITLSTPHHGTPMSNGPIRTAHFDIQTQFAIATLEGLIFGTTTYNEVNRVDLHWDNYDDLLDYEHFAYETNQWLIDLNDSELFYSRMIAYSAALEGEFDISGSETTAAYRLGSYIIEEGFDLKSDGIVPVVSANFDGKLLQTTRHFDNFSHSDIAEGKENNSSLFDSLKIDLLNATNLKLVWPGQQKDYIESGANSTIEWYAPPKVSRINIYLSTDNGTSWKTVASNISTNNNTYNWTIPAVNSENCLIKITDADNSDFYAVSKYNFTIYNNTVKFNLPNYLIVNNNYSITWEQQGIGNKARISFIDLSTDTSYIINENITINQGVNTYNWTPPVNIQPTNEGVFEIELTNLDSKYGIDTPITLHSKPFILLGEPSVEFLTAQTAPVDHFGNTGQEFLMDQSYFINWVTEGEIKFAAIYLCDSLKKKIKLLTGINLTPESKSLNQTYFNTSNLMGNKFYFYAEAGYALDSFQVKTYSKNSFRIGRKAHVIEPQDLDSTVALYPCVNIQNPYSALSYSIFIQDTSKVNTQIWSYTSNDTVFCTPQHAKNELKPGTTYQLTAYAHFENYTSFGDTVLFKTAAIPPADFTIQSPSAELATDADELEITWNHSVGATQYLIEILQDNDTIFSQEVNTPLDTSIIVSITDVEHYKVATVNIIAINSFGRKAATTTFTRTWKTNVEETSNHSSRLAIRNSPNPFAEKTTFEFYVPASNSAQKATLTIYSLQGQIIDKIRIDHTVEGVNKTEWTNNKQLASGCYLYKINLNGLEQIKTFQIIR